MKKQYITFLMVMIGICSASSLEQESEQLIVSKNKKKYISEQQYAELEGQMVVVTNQAMLLWTALNVSCVQLPQIFSSIQKKSLCTVNDYIESEKDCFLKKLDKIQRTECYEKLMKCKQTIESYAHKMKKMQQHIETMSAELQQQFQEITNIIERTNE